MRIASLTNTPPDPVLGSGKTVLAWSEGLRQLGHQVDVLGPADYYRPWPQEKGKRLKMRLDPLRMYGRILRGGYDLAEFYGAEFGTLIRQLSLRPRGERPLLVAHTNGLELLAEHSCAAVVEADSRSAARRFAARLLNRWMRRVDLWAFEKVDAFAAICPCDVDFLLAGKVQPPERCATVEPGVDEPFLEADWRHSKAHRLVCLGSWTARKDPRTLMAAAAQVLQSDSNVEFHVLGAWGARSLILEALPSTFHRRIFIHPRLDQSAMVQVLVQSKVFLFPSLYEGFGMATTEAMACGCAVVVTPTGFGASVRHDVDGLVCPFGEPAQLAAAVLRLLSDDPLRARIAAEGRARVAGLSWPRQVKALEGHYRPWLSSL